MTMELKIDSETAELIEKEKLDIVKVLWEHVARVKKGS